jgi:outer membrane lipopolysaccharide assembly protein LptE/RlpB
MFRRLAAPALLAFAVIGSACSHYRLGTGVTRDFESIFIAPVETNAVVPQSAALFTTQIRESFIRDGRLRVVNTPDEADAILSIELTKFRRDKLTSLPTDSGLARTFGLVLDASATLRDVKGEKTWFADRTLRVERQIFTGDGTSVTSPDGPYQVPNQQTQAEYTIVPVIGEDLAAKAKSAVLDTW